ncbi:MAG: hypothetical protein KDC84_08895 [Crocinitomicaceae bacterium]|nr:hypothetical protein [Crocinitomicaceae bacterium]
MSKILIILFLVPISLLGQQMDLSGEWEYRVGRTGEWKKVNLPGDLSQVIPNYKHDDYLRIRKTFDVSLDLLDIRTVRLQLENVTPYCQILVNGELIDTLKNFFIPSDIDIKESLLPGENELELEFIPARFVMEKRWKGSNSELSDKMKDLKLDMEVRQPRYMNKGNSVGVFGNMILRGVESIFVKSVNFKLITEEATRAKVMIKMRADIYESGQFKFQSTYFSHQEKILTGRDRDIIWTFFVDDYKNWSPKNMGEVNFLQDAIQIDFMSFNGKEFVHDTTVTYNLGFNQVKLVENPKDIEDYSFEIKEKSINVVATSFENRYFASADKQEDFYSQFFRKLEETDVNMIHVSGAGGYPSERFYHICDSLGYMVWQDFAFSGIGYPADSVLFKNAREEVDIQMRRISGHPCLVLFSGSEDLSNYFDSETTLGDYGITKKDLKVLEKGQEDLFGRIIPIQINRFNARLNYKSHSPDFGTSKSKYSFGSLKLLND